jgi:hypothetical protein
VQFVSLNALGKVFTPPSTTYHVIPLHASSLGGKKTDRLHPEDLDRLRRRPPLPMDPDRLKQGPVPEIYALLQLLLERVQRLEDDMSKVKTKLKLP